MGRAGVQKRTKRQFGSRVWTFQPERGVFVYIKRRRGGGGGGEEEEEEEEALDLERAAGLV